MADEGSSRPGLKKVAEAAFWSLRPCRLYLDDLEVIVGLFRQVHPKVRLRLAGYELESLADVPQTEVHETHKVDISFSGRDPHASFGAKSFGRGFQFYSADEDDIQALGLRDAIMRVADKRRLWAAPRNVLYALLWVFIVLSWASWLLPRGPLFLLVVTVAVAGMAATGAALLIAERNWSARNGAVTLRRYADRPSSFWRSNRDLVVGIVGAVIGALLSIVAIVVGGIILYAMGFKP